jgi:hypothetical protein
MLNYGSLATSGTAGGRKAGASPGGSACIEIALARKTATQPADTTAIAGQFLNVCIPISSVPLHNYLRASLAASQSPPELGRSLALLKLRKAIQ